MLRAQKGLEVRYTVNQVLTYWLETSQAGPKHLDRAGYAFKNIRPILGDLPVRDLTPAHIVDAAKTMMEPNITGKNGLGSTSVNIALRYLSVALNWAFKNRKIAENPLRSMPYVALKESARPYLSIDEVVPFLKEVDLIGTLHQRIAIRAQLLMGLREAESLHLRWEGFSGDWEFYTPSQTKSGKAQAIPVAKEVRRLVEGLPHKSELVLPGRAGSLHQKGYTRHVVVLAGEAIGKTNLTPHRLRASCATIIAGSGAGAHQIKDLLRHANIATSQFYVQQFPQSIKTLANKTFNVVTEEFAPSTPQACHNLQHQPSSPSRSTFCYAPTRISA
jgi:integrase